MKDIQWLYIILKYNLDNLDIVKTISYDRWFAQKLRVRVIPTTSKQSAILASLSVGKFFNNGTLFKKTQKIYNKNIKTRFTDSI